MYAKTGVAPGEVWRTLVVRERHQESPDTVSYVLSAPDDSPLPFARPGQYVSVQVPLPDGARQIRQYSLTRAPGQNRWGITVKAIPPSKTADGVDIPPGEVSNFLHHNLFEGDEITVSAPFGDLLLDDSDLAAAADLRRHRVYPDHRDAALSDPHRVRPLRHGAARRPRAVAPRTPAGTRPNWFRGCLAPSCTTGTRTSACGPRRIPRAPAGST